MGLEISSNLKSLKLAGERQILIFIGGLYLLTNEQI